jgi:hypothetical protein
MPDQVKLEGRPLAIFPCRADKTPTCPGGFKAAATDPRIIDLLWRDYPGPLVGVPMGERSGLTVLDIDTRRNGEAWLAEFEATHGFPATRIHATRSGGLHFVFKHRPGLKTTVDLIAPGVEVRADGAYVIWWPASGGKVLSDGPIAPWPASLDKALAGQYRQGASGFFFKGVDSLTNRDAPCQSHTRNVGLRTSRILTVLQTAKPGDGRNKKLYWAARRFGELIAEGLVSRKVAEFMLLGVAHYNGHVAKRGLKQTEDTIASGLDYQMGSSQEKADDQS